MSGNSFKTTLAQREAQINLWLSMAEPYLAEVSATAGFDWPPRWVGAASQGIPTCRQPSGAASEGPSAAY